MKQIKIKNHNNEITHFAEFETDFERDSFITRMVSVNGWGKSERWVKADQEDVTDALETREVETPQGPVTEYKLAAEYTIEQVDITAQVAQEQTNQQALAYLESTDWMVIRAAEGGPAVPTEVTTARTAARASIIR